MSYHFVQCSVQFARQLTIFLCQAEFFVVMDEFLKASRTSCFIVGIDDIPQRNRFRAVFRPNPVCIRKVDTNRCAWGGISGFSSNDDGFIADSYNILFFMLRQKGSVVLKPLCLF